MTTRTQLSTIVSPKIRQAYSRLGEMTGLNLTDLLTAAVPPPWHVRLRAWFRRLLGLI